MKSKAKSPRGVLLSLLTKFSKDAKAGKVYTALELDLLFSEYLSLLKETTKDNFVELELIGWKGKSGIDISKDFKNDFKIKEYRKDKQTGIVKELTHEVPFENVNNIKSFILTWKVGESRKCYDFAPFLNFPDWKSLWKERKIYFNKYYFPVKVLELLGIVEYSGRGTITRLK